MLTHRSRNLLCVMLLPCLLATAGENFVGVAKIALAAHVPVFLVEAGVSAFTVSFLFRVKPELLTTGRFGT